MTAPTRHRPWTAASRSALAALIVAGLFLGGASRAYGWGRLGHRVSARLCETLLTPKTKDAVKALLDPGETLLDASTWPDEHRRDRPETSPWHYVNVPITEKGYDPKFCQAEGCVVSKIPEFVATLKDPAASRAAKRDALRFLTHCVQDMHNPVHVGDRRDRGGNDLQVQFFGTGSNLHRVWDGGMIEHLDRDEAKTYNRLKKAFTPDFVKAAQTGDVVAWANESFLAARDAYVDPATGLALKAGAKLEGRYQDRFEPVVETRLLKASARLAMLLNAAFDPS